MKLTGGEIIAETLINAGIPYVVGIPGHGNLGLVDAFIARKDRIQMLQVRQESAAVHLADGYYRVSGRPLAVFTSIGPGACNTVIGAATCYVDSTPVLILTGSTHTHMHGKGVLQEIERRQSNAFSRVMEPVTKRSWQALSAEQLAFIIQRAIAVMMSGRRGPTHVDLPMDVQAEAADVAVPEMQHRLPPSLPAADPEAVAAAAELLCSAGRPVLIAGGGALYGDAAPELKALAEHLGAAVITTLAGKSAFPETHPLSAWLAGSKGTTVGLELASSADVLLAVGCRFADETTCSYKPGASFSIPPTKLIHLDIDPAEIGKNYAVEVALLGDAKKTLAHLAEAVRERKPDPAHDTAYMREIADRRARWLELGREARESDAVPMTMSRLLKELRAALPMEAIVVSSSGNTQAQILQEFAFQQPRTCITTGGFSTMGFTLPAALGARLAAPQTPVVGVVGDGDFLMAVQELATAVQYELPVVIVVANNIGWISIKDLQLAAYGDDRAFATDFARPDGTLSTPHLAEVARAFGCHGERIERPDEVGPAVERALQSGQPAMVECMVQRTAPLSGGAAYGWWDVPVPAYLEERRQAYEQERAKEMI